MKPKASTDFHDDEYPHGLAEIRAFLSARGTTKNEIMERRNTFLSSTKTLLEETLSGIAIAEKSAGFYSQSFQEFSHLHTVNLVLGNTPSDHSCVTEDSMRHLMKSNGFIAFCQLHNGLIAIVHQLPHIDEIMPRGEARIVEYIEPSSLSLALITEKVVAFFGEIVSWEQVSSSKSIGYLRGSTTL